MKLFGVLFPRQPSGAEGLGMIGRFFSIRIGEGVKILVHQRQKCVPVIIPGDRNHHIPGNVMSAPIAQQIVPGIGGDALTGAKDRHTERTVELGFCQQLVNHVLRRIVHHGDFFQYHTPLLVQFLLIKSRAQGQIGKNIHRQLEILVDHLGIEAGAFLTGKGIQLSAHHVHFFGDLPGSTVLRAFEYHVLDKVTQAVFFGQLVHTAHLHPHAHRAAVNVAEFFPHHPQTVWQSDLIEHNFFLSLRLIMGEQPPSFRRLSCNRRLFRLFTYPQVRSFPPPKGRPSLRGGRFPRPPLPEREPPSLAAG